MGVETLPSAAISSVSKGVGASVGSASLGVASFGRIAPSLDTYFPPSTIEASIFTIPKPESFTPQVPTIKPGATVQILPTSTTFRGEAAQTKQEVPSIGFLAETLSYPKLELPSFFETDTDKALAQKIATSIITSATFTPEEKALWQIKLQTTLEAKTPQTQTETEVTAQAKAVPKTQTQGLMETPPPQPPARVEMGEQEEPEEESDGEENIWKAYSVDRNWEIARDILKKRQETVIEAVRESAGKPGQIDLVRGKIAGLDIPSPYQEVKMARGEMEIPQVVAKIDHALDFADETDPESIGTAALEVVSKNTPREINKLVRFIQKVRQSELVRPARFFAELGASYIVLRRQTSKWEAAERLKKTEPIELEKEKARSTGVLSLNTQFL